MVDDVREPPVKLCCGQRHWTIRCPDGLVMCELCYDRFQEADLQPVEDDPTARWNICKPCWEHDQAQVEAKKGSASS
jgi:hypothetical protein